MRSASIESGSPEIAISDGSLIFTKPTQSTLVHVLVLNLPLLGGRFPLALIM